MPSLATRTSAPTVVDDTLPLPPNFPEVPADVLKRFPSMTAWADEVQNWWTKTQSALQGQTQDVSSAVTATNSAVQKNLFVTANGINAFAQQIIAVSAMAGMSTKIYVQSTPPVAPVLNDVWVDTSPMSATPPGPPVTRYWDGALWQLQTTIITGAAVAAELSARVTADGYLSGKYTLTVTAGNVVTGMNITSSTGGGTNISTVVFQADKFLIYNNTTGVAMFVVTAGYVQLGGVLTVDTPNTKVYIGAGNFNNADTGFYVDASGNFSLKDKLSWNGTTLSINGTITSTAGTIGGWTLGATSLVAGTGANTVGLDSGGTNPAIYAGSATPGSAPFRVTAAGALVASSATITGAVTCGDGQLTAANSVFYYYATSPVGGTLISLGYLTKASAQYNEIDFYTGNAVAGSIWNDPASGMHLLGTVGLDLYAYAGITQTGIDIGDGTVSIGKTGAGVANVTIDGSLTINGGLMTFTANDTAGAGYRYVKVPNA